MPPVYTAEVGRKFHPDGRLRLSPGLTVICPVQPGNPGYEGALWVGAQLQAQPFAHHFSFLPPGSFHMTATALVNDQRREAAWWPPALPLDAPLPQVDAYFIEAMQGVPPFQPPLMQATGLAGWTATVITLEPVEAEGQRQLLAYRDAVAAATGLRRPDHEGYHFHITFAYRIIEFEPETAAAFDAFRAAITPELCARVGSFRPDPAELRFYDDMGWFAPADERHQLVSRNSINKETP